MIKGDLKQQINFEKIISLINKNCSTCKHGYHEQGTFFCGKYPDEINFDAGDRLEQYYICDYWNNE